MAVRNVTLEMKAAKDALRLGPRGNGEGCVEIPRKALLYGQFSRRSFLVNS
jgi:hypothetical protein